MEVGAVARAPHEHPHVADHLVPGEEGGQRHQRREGGHDGLLAHAPSHIPGLGAAANTSDALRRYSEKFIIDEEVGSDFLLPKEVTKALELVCFVALEEAVRSLVHKDVLRS